MTDRRATLQRLHERILANDPVAPAELFSVIQRPLVSVLLRAYGRGTLTAEIAGDLATDAIIEYLGNPHKFAPDRASLFSYLAMIAKGDALNLFQARQREREGVSRFVELSRGERNIQEEEIDRQLDADGILRKYGRDLVDDAVDIKVLRLMLAGEKDTAAYADAIGMLGAAAFERNAAVKQRRDKLEKRLRRLGERL